MKPVVDSTAYLLISHGSRDSRPQEAMNRLADLVRSQLEEQPLKHQIFATEEDSRRSQPEDAPSKQHTAQHTALLPRQRVQADISAQVMVGTACLELAPMPLSEQIYEFGLRVAAAGATELKLLPVFLLPGIHVKEDIPQEVEAARTLLAKTALQLTLCPHLGSHEKIAEVLATRLATIPAEGSLLVAHGSRRPRGNKFIKRLANQLNTTVAYWSTPPDIETQVINLMQQGCQRLTILPYFLFPGGITDAITHRTEELAERFPKIRFRLLPTIGATDEVADLAIELASRDLASQNLASQNLASQEPTD